MASISEITGEQFNPEAYPDTFDLIPAGEYVAQIIESGILPTSKGDGQLVKFTFEIMEGEFEQRLIWANVNIVNPSPKSQSIGRKELAKIAKAAGLSLVDETEEMHYKPMLITVFVDEYKDKSGKDRQSSKISNYLRLEMSPVQAAIEKADQAIAARKAAPAPASKPAATGGKPWQRKAA